MTRQTTSQTLYAGRDVDFEEILHAGALGGATGLNNYLRTRSRQLARRLSQPELSAEDRSRIAAIAEAVEEAKQIMTILLSSPAQSKEGHPEAMQR